jgi:hypothetical protein
MARKGSAGGRHIAVERGLKPGWCGWPFRRELREFGCQVLRRAAQYPKAARRGAVIADRGGQARPRQRVGQPVHLGPDGATRGTGAPTGGVPKGRRTAYVGCQTAGAPGAMALV